MMVRRNQIRWLSSGSSWRRPSRCTDCITRAWQHNIRRVFTQCSNVLELIGVCTYEEPWMIVIEFVPFGDLKKARIAMFHAVTESFPAVAQGGGNAL